MEYGFNISFTMTSFLKTNNFPPFRFDELMTFRHFLKKKFLYFKSPKTAAIWEKKICLIYMYWIWHNLNLNRLRSAMINKVVRYFLEGNVHLIYMEPIILSETSTKGPILSFVKHPHTITP